MLEITDKWAPRSFIDNEVQLAAFYIDLLNVNSSALFTKEEQEHLYNQSLVLLDIAESQNPAWAEINYKRGELYFTAGKEQEAIQELEKAVHKNKMHFNARKELAIAYIQKGQVEKAFLVLNEGLKYPHVVSVNDDFTQIINSIKNLVAIKRAYETEAGKTP